jgi:Uma2 family endonuclease
MAAVPSAIITDDDLLCLGAKGQWVEVVNGEIVPMAPVGLLHHLIAGNVYNALYTFVRTQQSGYVFMDGLICVLERDPAQGIRKTRVPDTCFIRKGRILPDFDLSRPFPGAPDLAVEVVSPDESAADMLAKVHDYLDAGAEQVWVLYPTQREMHQFCRGEADTVHVYKGSVPINVESLLPGMMLTPDELFALPDLGR